MMFWPPSRFILITLLLSVLASAITIQKFKIEKLQVERDAAQQSNAEKAAFIRALHQQARVQEAEQQTLQQEVAHIHQQQIQRETMLKRIDETRLVRHWAKSRLPEPIIRLHEHGTFSNASAYVQRLPSGDAVQPPRKCTYNER